MDGPRLRSDRLEIRAGRLWIWRAGLCATYGLEGFARRHLVAPEGDDPGRVDHSNLRLYVYHDDDVEIYINGELAASDAGYVTRYVPLEISKKALSILKSGENITLAVHCHQDGGGQGIDVGFADVEESH